MSRTGKSEPWNTELHLVRRTDTPRPVVSPSLPLLKKTAHCANCQRSHRAPSGSRTIIMCTIVQHVVFVHVSSGQNDHKRHRHSKETMEIFVPNVNKLAQHLLVRKRLSSSFNCGKAGSRHWLHVLTPSHHLDGSQCLKLAGAFNSHVSPVTQFFCSFGSKSNL